MNSKQRRQVRRKYIYRVKIEQSSLWSELLTITRWLRNGQGLQGSWCRIDHGIYGFSNEQDAIWFGLKFSEN